jgi:hypothetical protein
MRFEEAQQTQIEPGNIVCVIFRLSPSDFVVKEIVVAEAGISLFGVAYFKLDVISGHAFEIYTLVKGRSNLSTQNAFDLSIFALTQRLTE